MVDFGSQYTGPTLFLDNETRRAWVSVHPVNATWYTPNRTPSQYDEHTQTMFLLKLAWACTIWKAQGKTFAGK
eukprot:14155452-Ditylum_brightwellii.AAC.1